MAIDKLDAACRQINEAIRMLFENRDPLAIHTLAAASLAVLRDLSKRKGKGEWLAAFNDLVEPGREKELWHFVEAPSNFLKHANRDPDRILEEFEEESNDAFLFFCCGLLRDLGQPLTLEMKALWWWFATMHPGVLKEGPLSNTLRGLGERLGGLPRPEQLLVGKNALELARIRESIVSADSE